MRSPSPAALDRLFALELFYGVDEAHRTDIAAGTELLELDVVFLNRSRFLVRASAIDGPACVARLSRGAFDTLAEANPDVRPGLYDRSAELARCVMLARLFLEMFEDLDRDTMQALLDATTVERYRGGDVIFEAATPSDGVLGGTLTARC